MGLESFIPVISDFRETNKLKILFDIWKEESLETYNVKNLKAMLSQEVENNVTFNFYMSFIIRGLPTCTNGFV